jgi:putative ABC transport system ATP-binding protein
MPQPFIRITNLRKSFVMGRETVNALAGVDADIAPNTFSAVIGPSGSGKSTLMYLIGGLDRPTSGQIEVNGEAIDTLDENALAVYRRKTVGFIFQSYNLMPSMTALDNVIFPMRFRPDSPRTRKEKALELLKMVGLADRAHHKPTELSGGQQQRVAIARSLVNDPQLILADEPTGNLDSHSGAVVLQMLVDLHRQGRTVLMVTHDSRLTRFATHTIRILDGKIVTAEEYEARANLLAAEIDKLEKERVTV